MPQGNLKAVDEGTDDIPSSELGAFGLEHSPIEGTVSADSLQKEHMLRRNHSSRKLMAMLSGLFLGYLIWRKK